MMASSHRPSSMAARSSKSCVPSTPKRAARASCGGIAPKPPSFAGRSKPSATSMRPRISSAGGGGCDLAPVRPPPQLLRFGESPGARALARLGEVIGYGIARGLHGGAGQGPTFAVVATMGENDEDSIAAAISARCEYVGVVASRNRFAEMRDALLERGVPREALSQVRNPAGLDLGARLPEEVAVSILAEIV